MTSLEKKKRLKNGEKRRDKKTAAEEDAMCAGDTEFNFDGHRLFQDPDPAR